MTSQNLNYFIVYLYLFGRLKIAIWSWNFHSVALNKKKYVLITKPKTVICLIYNLQLHRFWINYLPIQFCFPNLARFSRCFMLQSCFAALLPQCWLTWVEWCAVWMCELSVCLSVSECEWSECQTGEGEDKR